MGGYDQRYADVMGELQGVGDQSRADILAGGRSLQAGALQESVSRGLAGTTILPGLRMAAQRETAGNLARHGEGLARLRAGFMADLSGQKLQFMERRTDEGPNNALMAGLMQAYGQGRGSTAGVAAAIPRRTPPRRRRNLTNYGPRQPAFQRYRIGPIYGV
jgi:hypothetical protein